jgi:hypothetical protein
MCRAERQTALSEDFLSRPIFGFHEHADRVTILAEHMPGHCAPELDPEVLRDWIRVSDLFTKTPCKRSRKQKQTQLKVAHCAAGLPMSG